MKTDADFQILRHYWNHLSPLQRKTIMMRAQFYCLKKKFYILVIYITLFVARLVTPVPRSIVEPIRAHWL